MDVNGFREQVHSGCAGCVCVTRAVLPGQTWGQSLSATAGSGASCHSRKMVRQGGSLGQSQVCEDPARGRPPQGEAECPQVRTVGLPRVPTGVGAVRSQLSPRPRVASCSPRWLGPGCGLGRQQLPQHVAVCQDRRPGFPLCPASPVVPGEAWVSEQVPARSCVQTR